MEAISLSKIKQFAIEQGYKGAKYIGKWKNFLVYEPYTEYENKEFTGLPYAILIDENNNIRMSTSEEAFEIMGDENIMKMQNEELNNEKTTFSNENNKNNGIKIGNINATLADIFETAKILKIENIIGIKFMPSKTGYIAEVNANNKMYYMGISSFGFVEAVREDSLTGNLVYVPIE